MHDFIEKPSRMILFIVGVIALITIIILISKSRILGTGGQSLVDENGKKIAAITPTVPPAGENEDAGRENEEQAVYADVYDENEEEEWTWEDEQDTYDYETEEQAEEPDHAAEGGEEEYVETEEEDNGQEETGGEEEIFDEIGSDT